MFFMTDFLACTLIPPACSEHPFPVRLTEKGCKTHPKAIKLHLRRFKVQAKGCKVQPQGCSEQPKGCKVEATGQSALVRVDFY